MNDHHAVYVPYHSFGVNVRLAIMSHVELIDGGLCEIRPQRCQHRGISDGDLYTLGVLL